MRTWIGFFLLVGCAVPPHLAADGGTFGDSSVLVDSGHDADPPFAQDTGIGVDSAVADGAVDARSVVADSWMPVHLDLVEVSGNDLLAFRAAGAPQATVRYPDGTVIASGPTRWTGTPIGGPCAGNGASPPTGSPIANCMTWSEAFALCAWLGRRMPMEDEWNAEAGAPGPWEITSGTAPRPSTRGDATRCDSSIARVCDTHGNVSEWVVTVGGGGDVAVGESYRDTSARRMQAYPSTDVGVRCWGAAR